MKNVTVIISGAPEGQNLRHIDIAPGTCAGDILRAIDLAQGYLLSLEGSSQRFAAEEPVYELVPDGGKLRATSTAEVGGVSSSRALRFREAAR